MINHGSCNILLYEDVSSWKYKREVLLNTISVDSNCLVLLKVS